MKSAVSLYPENLQDLDNIEAVPVAFRTGYAATFDTTLSTCSATVAAGNPHNGVFSSARYTAVSTNGVAAERNGFDALGRRVWNWDGTTTNYFVYDGQQIIADVNATGGLVRSYVWGPGIDNLLAFTTYTGATAKTYFALTDHLGSVHALADETGTIVESYRFDAWGRVLGVYNGSGTPLTQSAVGNRFLWAGKEYSWRTGLYYNRSRVYDPITGRFLSKDPSGISGGMNEYLYCNGNPINFVDRDGRMPQWVNNALNSYTYSTVGRQFTSIGDAFGGSLAYVSGYRSGAQQVLQEAVNNSGYAILEEECAGKGAKIAYWGAIGISAAADITAGGLMIAGVDPWIGDIAYHTAHAGGPHQYAHLQFMLRTGQSITSHLRIPLPW